MFKDVATVTLPFDGAPYGVVRIADFFADDPNYRGGVRVAARDLDGDGAPELITAASASGTGVADKVRVFDPSSFGAAITEPVNRPPQLNPDLATEVYFPDNPDERGVREVFLGVFRDGNTVAVPNAAVLIDPQVRLQTIYRTAVGDNYTISLFPAEGATAAVTPLRPSFGGPAIDVVLSSSIRNSTENFVDVRIAPGDVRPIIGVNYTDADGGSSFYFFRLLTEGLSVAEGVEFPDPFPFSFQRAVFPDSIGVEGLSRLPGPANLVPTRTLSASERDRDRVFAEVNVVTDGAFVG